MKPEPAALLLWHDEADLLGVRVRAHFFDAAEVDSRASFVERNLPVFREATPRLVGDGEPGRSYRVGELQAQPDAVLEHGDGLLCLNHKLSDRRPHELDQWPAQLRIDFMLQTVIAAMAVAGDCQRPVAALLRLGNVLYQFDPGPAVLECLATHISAARRYWNAPDAVSPSQLASFCEPRLRALPGRGSVAGNPGAAAGDGSAAADESRRAA